MKQVIQSIRNGVLEVVDVPAPSLPAGSVLVHTVASLVSVGTERMVVDFAEKNALQKIRARPDLLQQIVDKAQREGVLTTLDNVRSRLEEPMPLGYSSAGQVIGVGDEVKGLSIGDRVACAGGGYAMHAEIVAVPQNLVVALPDVVDFESAAFTTLGAIALQGIRLADVKLGEVVAVIGLGLLGQLTVQMLKAAGCVVIGMDIQSQRANLALEMGCDAVTSSSEEMAVICKQFTHGHGVDATLITADTKSNEPVELAGEISREKGVVVAVGAVGMNIPRKVYYEKELDFRVSRSYGPGRYDPEYEEKGYDYPFPYVRWTERRNMAAFCHMLGTGKLSVSSLISHRFPIEDATAAYEVITGKTSESFLGVILTYPAVVNLDKTIVTQLPETNLRSDETLGVPGLTDVRLGVLGAGNFATITLLPALKGVERIQRVGIASNSGLSGQSAANRFGFRYCTTDETEILSDTHINTVAILTRHHLHARQVIAALESGKNIFVEKPLCLSEAELEAIVEAYRTAQSQYAESNLTTETAAPYLMVGFNRRFAPFIKELKSFLESLYEPLLLQYRVNAGYIPPDHWAQDASQGGGRLLGEGCHFIDLLIHLVASPVRQVTTKVLPDSGLYSQDNFIVTLEFANGSLGVLTYTAGGDKTFSKERLEVFGGKLAASMEDYRALHISKSGHKFERVARLRADKGHKAEWQAFVDYLTGTGSIPMTFSEIIASTQVTLAAKRSLDIGGQPVSLGE